MLNIETKDQNKVRLGHIGIPASLKKDTKPQISTSVDVAEMKDSGKVRLGHISVPSALKRG